jgi:hypothetical protein
MYGWRAGHYPTQMRKMLDVLKRKMLQKTYGPTNNTDQQRYRFKTKLYNLFKKPRLSVVSRTATLWYAGHIARREDICMPRRLMYIQPAGLRKVGRMHTRWRDEVGKDAKMLGIRS